MSKPALALLVLTILCASVLFQAHQHATTQHVLSAQIERDAEVRRLIDLKSYWQTIVADSPTFRDGFVQLAYIDWKLGNTYHAQRWITHVLEIDPNYQLPSTLLFLQAPLSQK